MNYRSVCLALLPLVFCLPAAVAAEMRFKHHFGDRNLSGSAWGQTALADLDGDGDLDFITGRSGGDVIWYEYHAADRWTRHLLGRNSPSEVGGAVLDVNRDGRPDFIAGGAWYENPSDPRKMTFKRHVFDAGLTPKQYQSGQTERQGRISGQVNKLLKNLLVEVCWMSLRCDPWARDTYNRLLRGSPSRKKIAITALARKLVVRCWVMLRDEQD